MSLEVNGTIKEIFDTQTFASGFSKREFVLTTEEQYPQQIKFEMVKERADALQSFSMGDKVKVSFNLRGNEYQGKYYVNLQAWRIERQGAAGSSNTTATQSSPSVSQTDALQNTSNSSEYVDDLPF